MLGTRHPWNPGHAINRAGTRAPSPGTARFDGPARTQQAAPSRRPLAVWQAAPPLAPASLPRHWRALQRAGRARAEHFVTARRHGPARAGPLHEHTLAPGSARTRPAGCTSKAAHQIHQHGSACWPPSQHSCTLQPCDAARTRGTLLPRCAGSRGAHSAAGPPDTPSRMHAQLTSRTAAAPAVCGRASARPSTPTSTPVTMLLTAARVHTTTAAGAGQGRLELG